DDADRHAQRHTSEGAACPNQQSERNRQQHANRGNQWEGQLDVPLHRQVGDIKPCFVKLLDVTPQSAPIHLGGLTHLTIEIAGWLGEFRQRRHWEALVTSDSAVGEVSYPASLKSPYFLRVGPLRTGGEHATLHLERRGVEFDDAQTPEKILHRVKEVIVVNLFVIAKNPALGVRIGLGRAAFNMVSERVLPLVGVGKICFVEHDHAGCKRQSREKQWHCEAVKANAAGFAGHDFIVLAHHSERDQHGDQSAQWRKVIKQVGSQIAEIIDHDKKWDAVACDVIEQLKKGESFKKENEHRHQHGEIGKETSQEIDIHQSGKAAARLDAVLLWLGVTVGNADKGRRTRSRLSASKQPGPTPEPDGWFEPAAFPSKLFHAGKQG